MIAGYWHQIPFVRFIIPFSVGIGISMFFPISFEVILYASIISFILLILNYIFFNKNLLNYYFGAILNFCFLLMGICLHSSQNQLNFKNHFSKIEGNYLSIEITEPAQLRSNSIKCKANVLKVVNNETTENTCGKLILYFEKDSSLVSKLKYGTRLLIPNNCNEIKAPQNPYEFNYKRYLAFNQIYQQAYLLKNEFVLIDEKGGNILWKMAYKAQAFFDEVLIKYVKSKNEIAISKALLYGYDDEISPDLVRAYSNTGTLHVLAVSGMHVGLIFWLINLLLKYLDKKKYQRIIKVIVSIIIIWSYSLLCGLSPSILRASVMFSFMAIGSSFKNKPNIYNTLAASAFILLLFDSNMLASVGFQLSFLAVFGIVSLQKYFKNWFIINNRIGNEIWNIISVSIAAQIATFPLGLLYFHQFPVYFLASNLLIIPLTTLIIFIAIAMIFFAAMAKVIFVFNYVASLFGLLVKWLIYFTNIIVLWLEKLPFSFVSGIHINEIETILIFIVVALICNYFISRKKYLAKGAFIFLFLFCIVNAYEQIKTNDQKCLTVYSINKAFAMQIFDGNKSILIADTALLKDANKFRFHLQQHIWALGIKNVDTIPFTKNMKLEIGDLKLNIGNKLEANCINIITKKTFIDTSNISIHDKPIILSSKLSFNQSKTITRYLKLKNILPYNCMESGAFTINIEN